MRRTHSLVSILPAWLLAPLLASAQEGGSLVPIPGPLSTADIKPSAAAPPMPGKELPLQVFAFTSAQGFIYNIINILFSFVALALFAALVYAAGLWITSLGGENVKKAKKILGEAALGIVITLLSYLAVAAIMRNFGSMPTPP